jgi:hypothetical protein
MDIKTLKLAVVQKIIETESESLVQKVHQLISDEGEFELTEAHLNVLNERKHRYQTEENETGFTWEEVQAMARKAIEK